MKILHTEWSDGWGGQERRIVSEMAGMQKRGHAVWLATRPTARIAEQARLAGIPVVFLPFAGKFHLPTLKGLVRLIRRHDIRIVNTHSGIDSWVGGLAARWAGTRLVRTRHLNIPLRRNLLNFIHYLPDVYVACGETMRNNLVSNCGFPEERVISIPTGIDFSEFRPRLERGHIRSQLGIGAHEWMILMVGVLRSVKGHDMALHAFAELLPALPNARLVLAGGGPLAKEIGKLADKLGIAAQVRFLGERGDIPDLLSAADAFLLTSRSEGVPQAVTQALGLGLPVVATSVGGVPELVIHEHTGLLVPPGNPQEVANALLRLASFPELAGRLGNAGRNHVVARFSLEAMLDETERLYQRLIFP
jgi:glycosyltransferase involved in cell wall biosynthesis